jgi:hypothetical protein
MKRETLHLPGGMSVETGKDWNGRYFICYAKTASVIVRTDKEIKRFLQLPIKTPSRDSLDSWLASLAAADQSKTHQAPSLSQELSAEHLQTGFGPECHLDQSDPNHQTRTII